MFYERKQFLKNPRIFGGFNLNSSLYKSPKPYIPSSHHGAITTRFRVSFCSQIPLHHWPLWFSCISSALTYAFKECRLCIIQCFHIFCAKAILGYLIYLALLEIHQILFSYIQSSSFFHILFLPRTASENTRPSEPGLSRTSCSCRGIPFSIWVQIHTFTWEANQIQPITKKRAESK